MKKRTQQTARPALSQVIAPLAWEVKLVFVLLPLRFQLDLARHMTDQSAHELSSLQQQSTLLARACLW